MGRALVPGGFISTLLASSLIHAAGSAKHLAGIASGDVKATVALLEAGGSWNPDAVAMPALKGEKMFVPEAGSADVIVVAARDGGELALYLVDAKSVEKTAMPSLDLTRRLYSVKFTDAKGELLARGDAARNALERALDIATVALSAEITGGMQRTMEMAVEYAKTRKQFGKPIPASIRAVQHQWRRHAGGVDRKLALGGLLRGLCFRKRDARCARGGEVWLKVYASDACREVGNRGVQVQGGMGFTWENDVPLLLPARCKIERNRIRGRHVSIAKESPNW